LHLRHPAGAAHPAQPAVAVQHRDAGGVIAAVLQSLEALDEHRDDITIGDRANDSAHGQAVLGKGRAIVPGAAVSRPPDIGVSADTGPRPETIAYQALGFGMEPASAWVNTFQAAATDEHPRHLRPGPHA